MKRNKRPNMLLASVRTRVVTPSATGYVTSHAISKNNGMVAYIIIFPMILEMYMITEKEQLTRGQAIALRLGESCSQIIKEKVTLR